MPSLKDRTARGARIVALAGAMLAAALPATAAPALWHLTSGHSEVWIIGAPNLAPKSFSWDDRGVGERLKGASVLIIEPQAKGNLIGLAGDLFSAARGLHSDAPMETTLPPPLRQRFQSIRTSIGQGPGKYAGWKPPAAGVLLTNDFLKAQSLEAGATTKMVRRLAKSAGVREQSSGSYDGATVITAAEQLNTAGQQTCLAASLHDIEQAPARVRMAEDWARGVIHPNPTDPADQACFNVMPQLKNLNEHLVNAEADAVVDALKRPGRSVAVFDLGATVMPGGVLDRIRAHGVNVPAPAP
jgi:uncharacterized protein YbaP (TraB family)